MLVLLSPLFFLEKGVIKYEWRKENRRTLYSCRIKFEELLQDIRDKKVNTIVVLKLDRLTRSVADWEKILTFLEENEAYLDCVNDDINTTNANGKMLSRILTSVSQ